MYTYKSLQLAVLFLFLGHTSLYAQKSEDRLWWKKMTDAEEIIGRYIKETNKSTYAVTAMASKTEKDSSWVYLSAFASLRSLKEYPPDFILTHPEGKVACYMGMKSVMGSGIDWYQQAFQQIGNRLCDDLKEFKDYKNEEPINCTFTYDPYEFKLTLYKGKFVKMDFLREPFPY